MRVYREQMPRSKCVHCVEAWFPDERDENKGRIGLMCEWDEWDDTTECRKRGCWYYRKRKEEKEAKND